MIKICYKVRLYVLFLKEKIKGCLLRLGCHFFSSWYFIDSENICKIGKVLKLNHLYTFEESDYVDIVRLTDVHTERGFLFCSLFFTSKNKIITVRHTLQKGTYVLWRLMDHEEFDEIMSRRLWYEVTRDEELLEFDF